MGGFGIVKGVLVGVLTLYWQSFEVAVLVVSYLKALVQPRLSSDDDLIIPFCMSTLTPPVSLIRASWTKNVTQKLYMALFK